MENENYKGVNVDKNHPNEDAVENHSPLTEDHVENTEPNSIGIEMDEEAAAKEKLTASDPTKVKFTSVNLDYADKNGEAKVDIQHVRTTIGMGKEELMKYANDPFWIRLRMTLFILFWLLWIAMLVGAVVIILLAPRCAAPPALAWWQKSTVYEVYLNSFKDTNNDGKGDLKGLTSKLDYFKDLKIDTLLLSPVYPSPMKDNGYDVKDFVNIDPSYGTMEDFDNLLAAMKKQDMKLVIDFIPNHSSNEHPWFIASENGEEPYKNFYVWADAKQEGSQRIPPNNWISVFGGSAWTWSEKRKQYYYHQFLAEQPDLNLRDESVREELKNVLEFWLEKGVDGIRIDAISHLFEDEKLQDEPSSEKEDSENPYNALDHMYTKGLPEIFDILKEWKAVLSNFSDSTGSHKVLIAESMDDLKTTMKYYDTVDIPFNFKLLNLTEQSSAKELKESMVSWMNSMPEDKWPNWVLGNHDVPRLATRVGSELVDGYHMVALLAKGTPVCYYGDELGMENVDVPVDSIHDTYALRTDPSNSRDPSRTPMQWSNDSSAGFTSSSKPWLPVHTEYQSVNVEVEKENSQSHLNIFSSLINIREQPAIQLGIMEYPLVTENIFSMIRVRKGSPGYLVAMNVGENSTVVDFTNTSTYLPETASLEVRSNNIVKGPLSEADKVKVKLNNVPLGPKQAAVFSFVPASPS